MTEISPEHTLTPEERRADWLRLAGLTALTLLALAGAIGKPLWNNDFITLNTISLSWGDVFFERLRNNHTPLYFYLLKGWTSIAGDGEPALRTISALFHLGSVWVVWAFARPLFGGRAALLAGLMTTLHVYLLESASEARMYTMLHFWITLSMLIYLRILSGGPRRWWAAHVAVSVAALSTHLLYGLALIAPAAFAWRARKLTRVCPVRILFILCLLPWLFVAPMLTVWFNHQYQIGQDSWMLPSLSDWLRHLLRCLWGEYEWSPIEEDVTKGLGIPLMLAALGLMFAAARRGRGELRAGEAPTPRALMMAFLPWWFLLPAVVLLLAAFRTEQVTNRLRYYAPSLAAAPMAITAAWSVLDETLRARVLANLQRWSEWTEGRAGRRASAPLRGLTRLWGALDARGWRRVFAALAVGLTALYALGFLTSHGSGLRRAVHYVAERRADDDALVVADGGAAQEAFGYYAGMPDPPAILKSDETPEAVLEVVDTAADGSERLWLLMFHEGNDSPIRETLDARGSGYRLIEGPLEWGESRVLLYAVEGQ